MSAEDMGGKHKNLTVKFSRAYSVYDEQGKRKVDLEWLQDTFKRRECFYYVATVEDGNRCECGRLRSEHSTGTTEAEVKDWTPSTHTLTSSTNAYGDIDFPGVPSTRAKYLRLSHDTKAGDILQVITDVWNLRLPKLLIEVTGGSKDFHLNPKLVRLFRKSIVKVAATTGAWILTGGINTGVVKHIGEAIRDHAKRSRIKIIAIGFAPWGVIDNRESLVEELGTVTSNIPKTYQSKPSANGTSVALDPNHSHFILVDNGTVNKYGVEIPLRSKLEKLISQQSLYPGSDQCLPIVCLVLEGGVNTINVALHNVTQNPPIPIVVVAGSGRAADLIAFAMANISNNGTLSNEAEENLMKRIVSAFPHHPEKHEDLLRDISHIAYRRNLVTIYSTDSATNEDIDHSILVALLKASDKSTSQLKLALIWNRVDIAKDDLFSGNKVWDIKDLESSLELALIKNRVDFVSLLLEHVCVKGFLTTSRMERLYNAKDEDSLTTFSVFTTKRFPAEVKSGQHSKIKLYQVGLVMEQLIGHGFLSSYTRRIDRQTGKKSCCGGGYEDCDRGELILTADMEVIDCSSSSITSPLTDLFIWAVLTSKYDMAYLFWQRGIEALAKSIVAFHLFSSMSESALTTYNSDAASDLQEQSDERRGLVTKNIDADSNLQEPPKFYRVKSIDLLTQSYEDDQQYTRLLICAEMKNWSSWTCLSMAAQFHHIGFISHPAVQTLLNDQWYGIFRFTTNMKSFIRWVCCCTSAPEEVDTSGLMLNPAYSMRRAAAASRRWSRRATRQQSNVQSNSSAVPDWRRHSLVPQGSIEDMDYSVFERLFLVATAPVVKFWLNALFFFAFLVTFSYVIMTQMVEEVSLAEWVVVATILSLTTEELRQIATTGDNEKLTFSKKLKQWASDKWNLVDLVGVLLFYVGFAARMVEMGVPFWGRMFYSVDIILWYLRVLDILSVKKFMGPYVNMVGKMMTDIVSFIVLLLVFMTGYGVAARAILHPNKPLNYGSLEEIFSLPYWQIYGELFMEEFLPDCANGTVDMIRLGTNCSTAYTLVLIIMAGYLLIANVLLLNLLIAIFNNTFSAVIENANDIWKYHRYELIIEFSERPFLPPPLMLFLHVIMVIRWILYACCRVTSTDSTMKVALEDDATQLLRTFEEECIENYLRQQTLQEQASIGGMVQRTNDRIDFTVSQLEQLHINEADARRRLRLLTEHVDHLASLLSDVREAIRGEGRQENSQSLRKVSAKNGPTPDALNHDSGFASKARKISTAIGLGKTSTEKE